MTTLNTTQHLKIWFSKNPDEPLGIINELRLIKHREKNKNHTITLISEKSLLSAKGKALLQNFCSKYNIDLWDFSDVKTELKSPVEIELYNIVENEVHLPTGNLAAASDILRWLTPVIEKGIYSDLDVEIDFRKIPSSIQIDDFLLLASAPENESILEEINCNNCFLAIANPSHPLVESMQRKFLENYGESPKERIEIRPTIDLELTSEILFTSGPKVLEIALLELFNKESEPTVALARHALKSSPLNIENSIMISSDQAWLNEGVEALKETKEEMNNAAKKIQSAWRCSKR